MQTVLALPTIAQMPELIAPPIVMPPRNTAGTNTSPLLCFGLDQRGRQRGAQFVGTEPAAVERAADLMDLYFVAADTEALTSLAAKLPAGRLFESGRALIPYIKKSMYNQLIVATNSPDTPMPVRAAGKPVEAPPPAGASSGGKGSPGAPGGAAKSPTDWTDIGIGSTVLACQGPMEGWWEAVVLYTKANENFVLRFRDWPLEPEFTRARKDLGLMPPGSREGLG